MGTYTDIRVHIASTKVSSVELVLVPTYIPPYLAGGSKGAKPPEKSFRAPYSLKPSGELGENENEVIMMSI